MSDHVVRIYASTDTFGAELMKGRLESEGISVMMKGENEGPYRMGPASLWVLSGDEIRARAIVDAVASGAFAVADDDVMEPTSEDAPE
jgi:Putative prokaryotic signal transducing protein